LNYLSLVSPVFVLPAVGIAYLVHTAASLLHILFMYKFKRVTLVAILFVLTGWCGLWTCRTR